MAPDAEKVRQRKPVVDIATQSTANEKLISNVSYLQPTEIAIDGVIYNLETFNHPGGESIKTFGGNDVTVQYRMIHPYHTSKHLEKMQRVGKVADYVCE
jgi:acyl-lipid (7-3)-desaturase (Delta-4 desaturase)